MSQTGYNDINDIEGEIEELDFFSLFEEDGDASSSNTEESDVSDTETINRQIQNQTLRQASEWITIDNILSVPVNTTQGKY
ncbi:hypothetical protein FQA39_LY00216 [Lamprigera yunnana]|nr:hypothetical protein FQA39_LY00216 [Lamprigera yunnana]